MGGFFRKEQHSAGDQGVVDLLNKLIAVRRWNELQGKVDRHHRGICHFDVADIAVSQDDLAAVRPAGESSGKASSMGLELSTATISKLPAGIPAQSASARLPVEQPRS